MVWKNANQYLQFVNFVRTTEPCLWQNRWFFLHKTLNGAVVHAAPIPFVHGSFQPLRSIRPWHIIAYQHITFTASLWLCMTSCLQRGSGLTNRRKQYGKKIQPAYSSSHGCRMCLCIFPSPFSYRKCVHQKEKEEDTPYILNVHMKTSIVQQKFKYSSITLHVQK